ncbi:MAG: VOC family protein [Pseudomonadota bacterium]
MIDHVSIGVSDIDRARRFYRAVLRPLEMRCLVDLPGKAGFGKRYPEFWILARPAMEPHGEDVPGHVALRAGSVAAVEQFHEEACARGGRCDGAPGLRAYTMANAFAAFVRDPDGNRIEAVHLNPTAPGGRDGNAPEAGTSDPPPETD